MRPPTNKLRNATWSRGSRRPVHWTWRSESPKVKLVWGTGATGTLRIISDSSRDEGFLSQVVAVQPERYYRAEVEVGCELVATASDGGFVLVFQPLKGNKPDGEGQRALPLLRASTGTIVSDVFQAPAGVRRVRVSVGISSARGVVTLDRARFMASQEPDAESHPMALPPPCWTRVPPKVVQSVCVCASADSWNGLRACLATEFGGGAVPTVASDRLDPDKLREDAIFLPDPLPPPAIRTITDLMRLAANRVVVISLPAFASLQPGRVRVRRVEQAGEVPHARVIHSNFATRGFALHDVFPFAWTGKRASTHVQNQLRKSAELSGLMKRQGLATLLESACATDSTSEHPIALFKTTDRGALFVFDVDALESPARPIGQPVLAMHLLRSMLGRGTAGLGQYTIPHRRDADFRELVRETGRRFEPFVVHDDDAPSDRVTGQWVTVGGTVETFGLPPRVRPAIVVRTALDPRQAEAVYGAYQWFKNLVRPPPFVCPYAKTLTSAYRLMWIPGAANAAGGADLEMEDPVAAVIELVSRPVRSDRLIFARADAVFERAQTWLVHLSDAFGPRPPAGSNDANRLTIEVNSAAFEQFVAKPAFDSGGTAIRIELPRGGADFTPHSIARTDQAATLLERVVGLVYGLMAVNRTFSSAIVDGLAPVAPGAALILERSHPALDHVGIRAG